MAIPVLHVGNPCRQFILLNCQLIILLLLVAVFGEGGGAAASGTGRGLVLLGQGRFEAGAQGRQHTDGQVEQQQEGPLASISER